MKKLLFIFCLLCMPIVFGSSMMSPSPLFETYIGSTKNQIIDDLRDKSEKFTISDRIQVRVDSLNRWLINDNYYTYFFDFDDGSKLAASFSNRTNLCTNYLYDFTDCDYRDDIFLFNEAFERMDSLTWYESDSKSVIKLFITGYRGGYSLYAYKKQSDPFIDIKTTIKK